MERDLPFLIVVTEVDLSSSSLAYTLALPSRLTNVVVVSTRRLDPGFWGEDPDIERAARRLAALMRHGFGHLVGLGHEADRADAMRPLGTVEDLDRMGDFSPAQRERIARALPREANERSAREGKPRFVVETLVRDAGAIGRAVARANPFRLLARMPTMLAAALSVIVVLLFSAETWDMAYSVSVPQIALFLLICLGAAAFVLHRAFAFEALMSRDRRLTESGVVTAAATTLSLMATLVVMFAFFGVLMYLGHRDRVPRAADGVLAGATARRRRRSTTSSSRCSWRRWASSRARSAGGPTAATSCAASCSPRRTAERRRRGGRRGRSRCPASPPDGPDPPLLSRPVRLIPTAPASDSKAAACHPLM